MISVIPSINCPPKDFECVYKKLALAQDFAEWVHLDIADGAFTFHKSWNEPAKWPQDPGLKVEVHLMVEDTVNFLEMWEAAASVNRFIVHAESLTPAIFHAFQKKIRAGGRSVMLALNPETPVEALEPFMDHLLQFQILGVHPGLSGQKFLPRALDKISWIRHRIPNAIIEVDGGITPEVAREAHKAGADIVISDTYIFGNPDPAGAYKELTLSS